MVPHVLNFDPHCKIICPLHLAQLSHHHWNPSDQVISDWGVWLKEVRNGWRPRLQHWFWGSGRWGLNKTWKKSVCLLVHILYLNTLIPFFEGVQWFFFASPKYGGAPLLVRKFTPIEDWGINWWRTSCRITRWLWLCSCHGETSWHSETDEEPEKPLDFVAQPWPWQDRFLSIWRKCSFGWCACILNRFEQHGLCWTFFQNRGAGVVMMLSMMLVMMTIAGSLRTVKNTCSWHTLDRRPWCFELFLSFWIFGMGWSGDNKDTRPWCFQLFLFIPHLPGEGY